MFKNCHFHAKSLELVVLKIISKHIDLTMSVVPLEKSRQQGHFEPKIDHFRPLLMEPSPNEYAINMK